jgi:hypothetical protein
MTLLTPNQIQELMKMVDKYQLTFIARHIGASILTDEERGILESHGIDVSKITPHSSNVTEAFKFGLLSIALSHASASKLTYDQLKTSLKDSTFIPLNRQESAMLESLKYNTYSHVSKLGGNIKNDIRNGLVEVDRKGMARAGEVVRNATKEAIEKRKGVTEIVSILGEKTGQWNRDLLKIASYNLHEAFNQGRAMAIEKEFGDNKVYFDVYLGACKNCVKAYLTGGIGSQPKVFKVQELRNNGSNIGKKVIDWKPTLSPTHPFCRCTVNRVPEGYVWDEETASFTKPDKEFERKVERKSRVNVTVNGKTTEI